MGTFVTPICAGIIVVGFIVFLGLLFLNKKGTPRIRRQFEDLYNKLSESRWELEQAQQISMLGSWSLEVATGTISVSREFMNVYGIERTVIDLSEFFTPIVPSYKSIVRNAIEEVIRTGEKREAEYRIITQEREDKIIKFIGQMVRKGDSDEERLYGTIQDITQMKLAAEQLHIQRDLAVEVGSAASLQDAAALSVFGALELINADCGGVCLMNSERGRLEIIYCEGIRHQTLARVFGSPYRRLLWSALKRKKTVELTKSSALLNRIDRESGEKLLCINFYPFIQNGLCIGALAAGSHSREHFGTFEKQALESLTAQIANIISQKQIEEAFRKSEKRYRGLFASMLHGVVQIDEEGQIMDSNRAFQDLTGYSAGELRKMNLKDITPHRWLSKDSDVLRIQVLKKGYSEEYEKEFYRKDGSAFPVSVRVWINEDEFGKREFWSVIRDIGEKKEHESMIRQMIYDLSRSNTELQQFAYAASHDLQEPLRAMTGFSELLLKKYDDILDDEGREFTHYIIDAADRMRRLIEDLLSYSRLHTDARPFESVDCIEAVELACANLTILISESGAEVECGHLPVFQADKPQIIQLFQNLISNAIKYRNGDKKPKVVISSMERKNAWELCVEDNGVGIKQEHIDTIFKMFQRLHTREEYDGTGIGLALCRRIVERHQGRIWAESEYGKGSRFYFTIGKELNEA